MGSKAKWVTPPITSQPDRDCIEQLVEALALADTAIPLLRSTVLKSRLEDMGQQSCTLAHELRQPLFTIAMANENLRLMLESADPANARMLQSVARVAEQVERAQAIIMKTLDYAKGTETPGESCDPGEAAANAARFLSQPLDRVDIEVELRGNHGLGHVGLSRIEMEQVFVNLLRNAVESIVDRRKHGWLGKGRIVVTVERSDNDIRCIVTDNGAGLSDDMAEAVFQPFFTTKSREGTGLGLHICRQIVAKADGVIRLLPGRDEGALVEIRMPRVLPLVASEVSPHVSLSPR